MRYISLTEVFCSLVDAAFDEAFSAVRNTILDYFGDKLEPVALPVGTKILVCPFHFAYRMGVIIKNCHCDFGIFANNGIA